MTRLLQRSVLMCATLFCLSAMAQEPLKVYGPGGPAPAMKEAAADFEKMTGVKVVVTAGPTPTWIASAKSDADVIFGGSETMMSDFVNALSPQLTPTSPEPLYLRPMAMLVRPGNPQHIERFSDLLKPGVKILVVNGAGQNGVWEDVAGRTGDLNQVKVLRHNIVGYASNSAEARKSWIDHPDIDVWLIWNIWQVANPTLADVIPIEPRYAIFRDTAVAITLRGDTNPASQQFVDFLKSEKGAAIFKKWGWLTEVPSGKFN